MSATEGYTRFINKSYTYPTGTNIGKISSQTDSISGEVVNYTYDSLNRLATAATANTAWGQSYTYDAFGNLTGESVTQGSAPSMTLAGSSATNQYGGGYDLNGNMTTSGATTMTYDVANRMIISATSTGSAHFSYDTRNRRVWQWNGAVDQNNNPVSYSIYYYGANGKRLVAYTVTLSQVLTNGHISGYNLNSSVVLQDTYFGRRRLAPMDRIGSAADVGAYPGQQSISFFPYGQDKGTAGASDNWKFATYWRDSATGLDYAMNRYYSSAIGRFLSPDPYISSAGPSVPQSWNRYGYVLNDPVNWVDPGGLANCAPGDQLPCTVTVSSANPGAGGGPGGPIRVTNIPANPSPLTPGQAWLLAQSWQKRVASGTVTDCYALAGFAQNAADDSQTDDQFVQDFGALVPKQFGVPATLTWWSVQAVQLNNAAMPQPSGYLPQFQNTLPDNLATGWNGDQGHHFAAFFEFGYLHGVGFGSIAALVFEYYEAQAGNGVVNQGDINLGIQAAFLGYQLATNAISPGDVASGIAALCNH